MQSEAWIFRIGMLPLAHFTLCDIFICSRVLFSEKPNVSHYMNTRPRGKIQIPATSSSAEGREIKFRAFQLYYIGGRRKCIRYCEQNARMPRGVSLYFLLLRISRQFSVFDFSICLRDSKYFITYTFHTTAPPSLPCTPVSIKITSDLI